MANSQGLHPSETSSERQMLTYPKMVKWIRNNLVSNAPVQKPEEGTAISNMMINRMKRVLHPGIINIRKTPINNTLRDF